MNARSVAVVAVLGAFALAPTPAARADAFADALADSTGSAARALVLTKLTTFKVGPKCLARLADKHEGAIHAASFYTSDIAEYAKAITGDDWSAIEGKDKALVEEKVEAFKARLAVTVMIEGEDCDAKSSSLWLRYWTAIASALKSFPPAAKRVAITLDVRYKMRDLRVVYKTDGSSFEIIAPKEIEATSWADELEKPFRRNAAGLPDDFSFEVKESVGRYASAWVLSKLTTFKVGAKCLPKLSDKSYSAIHMASFYTRDILEYVKAIGGDDWDRIEQQSANDPKTNRALVEKLMNEFKPRLGVTVTVEGDDCNAKHGALWLSYWGQIATSLKNYPPRAAKVSITLDVTAKAKDVSITVGKDGATFAITAPRDVEPPAWTDKYDAAFKKVARKP